MNVLIFGGNGQDGYYVSELCVKKELKPIIISRSRFSNQYVYGDVADYDRVVDLIKYYQPYYIFHFAANSTTQHDALFDNHNAISTGTLNILEASYKHSPSSKVFIAGSALQFKNSEEPISEDTPFLATSPYGISRIHAVYTARYYRSLGLPVYVGYLFHHESVLRKAHHISKKIALAVQRIAGGDEEYRIEIGDITVQKEWTFAGDVANAMLILMEQNDVFEAIIGSGLTFSIENWLEQCFRVIDKDWHKYVKITDGYSPEYKIIISNPTKINSLGWLPSVSFPNLAYMMINNIL